MLKGSINTLLGWVILALAVWFIAAPLVAHANPIEGQSCNTGPCRLTHISTNASTQVVTGPGFVHAITINTKGASANVATVYDDTDCSTAPVKAIIDTTVTFGTLLLDGSFSVGLCVKTATGTAADITVSAR